MVLIHAEIELINGDDLVMVRRNLMDQDDLKRMFVTMLVDSAAYNLYFNEVIQEQLQLPVVEKRKAQLANGTIEEFDVDDNVQVSTINFIFSQ